MMTLKGILLSAALVLPLAAGAACRPTDMKIEDLKVQGSDPRYSLLNHVLGRMVNNCSEPIGAEVKIIYYGKGKELLKVQDVWPASVNNVDAHGDFPFDIVFEPIPGFERLEMRILRVQRW